MGRHNAPSTTRKTITAATGVVGAVGLAVTLTSSAAADPVTPITCQVAPGPGCPVTDGVIDAELVVDPLLCARAVVVHDDGRLAAAGVSVPCPPPVVIVPQPKAPTPPAAPAPAPRIIDGASSDVELPRVNN